jgi:3-oxoacyl-[acyl-carrier protein] reductase
MDLDLADKVVLITGASGGIGRALAETFAAEGSRLILHGHARTDALRAWLDEQPWKTRALVVRADVRDAEAVAAAVAQGRSHFGRVDCCVANAGAWTPSDLGLHEASVERLTDGIAVNLLGSMWTARAFLTGLAQDGPRTDGHGASLVFIGSTAGRFGEQGHAEYAAAKAGLLGLMRSLKNEIVALDPFGRVNVVEPGWTVTHMARPALEQAGVISRALATMPVRQLGRAEDVARTVTWLCSPSAARHVSGQVITVAGGMEGRQLWEPADIDEDAVRRRTQGD